MPRKPKGREPERAEAIASWFRAGTNFSEMEKALGAKLDQAQRDTIELSMAFAVEGEWQRRFGKPTPVRSNVQSLVAQSALTRARLQSPRPARAGRSRSNENWSILILELAEVFKRVRGERPGISFLFKTGEIGGIFYTFVQAVFAEVPHQIKPAVTAVGPLIKRTLMQSRRQPGAL